MSFAARATAEKRYKDARYNRRRRRMERIEVDDQGVVLNIICRDNSLRRPDKSGLEGAQVAACQQVKVSLVPVLIAIIPKKFTPGTPRHLEEFERRVDTIYFGEDLQKNPLDPVQAAKRYFRRDVDECQRIKQIRAT